MLGALLLSVLQGAKDKRELKPFLALSTVLNIELDSTFLLAVFRGDHCLVPSLCRGEIEARTTQLVTWSLMKIKY